MGGYTMTTNITKAFTVLAMAVGLWGCGNNQEQNSPLAAGDKPETVSQDVAVRPPAAPAEEKAVASADKKVEDKAMDEKAADNQAAENKATNDNAEADTQEMVIDESEAAAEEADRAVEKSDDAVAASVPAGELQPEVMDGDGVKLNSIILAKGVDKREPVEPGTRFSVADGEKVYAIMDVNNPTDDATELTVSWKMPDSDREIGKTSLEVKSAKSWRTWSFTRWAKKTGTWEAIVRNADGDIIARAPFEIQE